MPASDNLLELLAPPDEPVKLYHEIEADFITRGAAVPPGVRMLAAMERALLARAARRRGRRYLRVA